MADESSLGAGMPLAQERPGYGIGDLAVLAGFGAELYSCLIARADELFELADSLLCTDGPVKTLVDLVLAPEHRRGHGALYEGLNRGPPGSKNHHKAPIHHVGKTVRRETTLAARFGQAA